MACIIGEGIGRGCRDNAGGMYSFFVANLTNGITSTPTLAAGGIITDIKDKAGTPATLVFYEFRPNKNSGVFTEEYQISLENGTHGYTQTVTGNFSKLDQAKQDLVDALSSGDFAVIVKDKNGNYFLMGEGGGAAMSGGNAGTGTALSDLNGYALTLTAEEGSPARQVQTDKVDTSTDGQITVVTV